MEESVYTEKLKHVPTWFKMRVIESVPEFICQTLYYLLMHISIFKVLQDSILSTKRFIR
jgi:hypothetical protein